ncbi:MAG TPA: ABC transporter permease, partial [Bdellovibrionales bacterium]|nr:ABC transporter permease [Bdellovibrionales bacterium]
MQLKIAFRNIFRNKRRTALSIGMIAGGFSAIILFQGFVGSIEDDL